MISFVVCITEHCNLNCASCDHFSPLSKERFIDLDDYSKQIYRMAEITGGEVERIHIEGGEPLLHPQVNDFLRITRKAFSKTQLILFTNGILLDQMGEDFWRSCNENEIIIKITKYPININYNMIESMARERKVKIEYASDGMIKKMRIQKLDLKGEQNPDESYKLCYMSHGSCAELRDGKLYTCTQSANLDILGDFFDVDISYDKKDYVDIYENVDLDKIKEFLNRSIPICRYCKTSEWDNERYWSISRKSILEWT